MFVVDDLPFTQVGGLPVRPDAMLGEVKNGEPNPDFLAFGDREGVYVDGKQVTAESVCHVCGMGLRFVFFGQQRNMCLDWGVILPGMKVVVRDLLLRIWKIVVN